MPSRVPWYLVSGWLKNILKFRNVSFIRGKVFSKGELQGGRGESCPFLGG